MKPDVTFLGFDLKREDAIADPGWFFVIQQQPTEPRFGLDAADFDKPLPPLTTWNDLSWRHLAKTEEELKSLSHASIKTVLPDTWHREVGPKLRAPGLHHLATPGAHRYSRKGNDFVRLDVTHAYS